MTTNDLRFRLRCWQLSTAMTVAATLFAVYATALMHIERDRATLAADIAKDKQRQAEQVMTLAVAANKRLNEANTSQANANGKLEDLLKACRAGQR